LIQSGLHACLTLYSGQVELPDFRYLIQDAIQNGIPRGIYIV
jgi:hypothetical protein